MARGGAGVILAALLVMRTLVALGALSLLLTAPREVRAAEPKGPPIMPYTQGAPVPPGYHVGPIGYTALAIGGILSFGLPYALGAIAIGFDGNGALPLLLPVLGPFVAAAAHKPAYARAGGVDAVSAIYLVDGAAQVIGATMIILGLSLRQDALFRNDVYPPGKEPVVLQRWAPRVAIGPGSLALSVPF